MWCDACLTRLCCATQIISRLTMEFQKKREEICTTWQHATHWGGADRCRRATSSTDLQCSEKRREMSCDIEISNIKVVSYFNWPVDAAQKFNLLLRHSTATLKCTFWRFNYPSNSCDIRFNFFLLLALSLSRFSHYRQRWALPCDRAWMWSEYIFSSTFHMRLVSRALFSLERSLVGVGTLKHNFVVAQQFVERIALTSAVHARAR